MDSLFASTALNTLVFCLKYGKELAEVSEVSLYGQSVEQFINHFLNKNELCKIETLRRDFEVGLGMF